MKSEHVFLILGLLFGLAFVFVTPPFQVPDEYNHFFRAYEISQGKLLSQKVLRSNILIGFEYFPGSDTKMSSYAVGDYLPKELVGLANGISHDIPGKISSKQDKYYIILNVIPARSDSESRRANRGGRKRESNS